MIIYSDLHIHSKYSRACSKDISLMNLDKFARYKGLNLLGTGDFTYDLWMKEIKENLIEYDNGFYVLNNKLNNNFNNYNNFNNSHVFFVIQTEVSLMFRQDNKYRRIHLVVLSPSIDIAEQITYELSKRKTNLKFDGRPMLFMNCLEFMDLITSISNNIEIIPAHIWTPWYGILGSKTGFDDFSCFGEYLKKIHSYETGLSSDPEMNWNISFLNDLNAISNSDAHSYWPWRLGREFNIFNIKPNYNELIKAIRNKNNYSKNPYTIDYNQNGLIGTIEVDPAYGKYHYDGHKKCNYSISPEITIKQKQTICPVCNKPLTIGVLHRVLELSDQKPQNIIKKGVVPFKKLLPLAELLSFSLNSNLNSKRLLELYFNITKDNSEIDILLNLDYNEIKNILKKYFNENQLNKIINLIIKNRNMEIRIKPGFDGEYGKIINVFENIDVKKDTSSKKINSNKNNQIKDRDKRQNTIKNLKRIKSLNDFI